MQLGGRSHAFSTPPDVCGWRIRSDNGALIGVPAGGRLRSLSIPKSGLWEEKQMCRSEANFSANVVSFLLEQKSL